MPSKVTYFTTQSKIFSTVNFRFKRNSKKSSLNRKSSLNQTLFNLFYHFGKSETSLNRKNFLRLNVLKSKNYCNTNQHKTCPNLIFRSIKMAHHGTYMKLLCLLQGRLPVKECVVEFHICFTY